MSNEAQELNNLANLCHQAAMAAEKGQWMIATDILQGRVVPAIQSVTHDVWLHYHKSGTGEA